MIYVTTAVPTGLTAARTSLEWPAVSESDAGGVAAVGNELRSVQAGSGFRTGRLPEAPPLNAAESP